MTLEILKACGEFLNITKLESFPDKESLAERIVMQIETFFPTKCSECDEMYTIPNHAHRAATHVSLLYVSRLLE